MGHLLKFVNIEIAIGDKALITVINLSVGCHLIVEVKVIGDRGHCFARKDNFDDHLEIDDRIKVIVKWLD